MLLHPKSSCEAQSKNLQVNIDDMEPSEYYAFSSLKRYKETHFLISIASSPQCPYGQNMNRKVFQNRSNVVVDSKDGVFVKGKMGFYSKR
ncbi:hypothetical protein MRB53_010324 [Persea americana]|uniref:Uncharacterized protein n=1 Tax=Persea americana TaxID=3435 RepID=A0ACC2LRJ8_PERAE|nr:hypothetical protein MRB53_010324 [Persea americana]